MRLLEYHENGQWDLEFVGSKKWPTNMDDIGEIPLPPYINREHGPEQGDLEQYQTVFNQNAGSAAAPTASRGRMFAGPRPSSRSLTCDADPTHARTVSRERSPGSAKGGVRP